MEIRVSVIISQLFKIITLAKCFLTILELNWNQRFRNKTTKLNICHHMLSSSTQLQNRSFHVVEGARRSAKCEKMKNARAKRAKMLILVVKYANLWLFRYRRRRGCLRSLNTRVKQLTLVLEPAVGNGLVWPSGTENKINGHSRPVYRLQIKNRNEVYLQKDFSCCRYSLQPRKERRDKSIDSEP